VHKLESVHERQIRDLASGVLGEPESSALDRSASVSTDQSPSGKAHTLSRGGRVRSAERYLPQWPFPPRRTRPLCAAHSGQAALRSRFRLEPRLYRARSRSHGPVFGNVTERRGHTPRVGGRCESDPPGPDPEGTSLRTARLKLLPLTSRDESDHARVSRNAADALRDTRAADVQWREHGFGPWAVRDKQGSCFLGCAELRLAGEGIEGIAPDEVEAGWWVTEDRRNDGIATEAMEAAIDDLFSRTDVETITAYISDGGNEASRRVAAKLGFSVRGRGHGRSGEPMTVYTLPRDDWLRQRP
jgi:RimJ/RimL family protein N-acetyltransferase